jgi:hypothetical protein
MTFKTTTTTTRTTTIIIIIIINSNTFSVVVDESSSSVGFDLVKDAKVTPIVKLSCCYRMQFSPLKHDVNKKRFVSLKVCTRRKHAT